MEWLAYGDRNSNFVHHKASERLKKNKIECLFNNSGDWCTRADNILSIVSSYFNDIFTSFTSSFSDMEVVLSCARLRVA